MELLGREVIERLACQRRLVHHVGIGSDFDGISSPPKGLEDISKMGALKAALRKRGYSEDDLKKIFGLNTLRVLREVTGK